MKKLLGAAVCAAALLGGTVAAPVHAEAATTKFKNCASMNKVYKHGVAKKKGVKDKVRGNTKPVTNYTVNAKVYQASYKSLDRDKDGIMCEKA